MAVRRAARALLLAAVAAWPGAAAAVVPELSPADIREALEAGAKGMAQEDFAEEWRFPLDQGGEIAVSTPFSRLALAARQAALKGEPLSDKQRQEQLDRGKGKIQLMVTMIGPAVDFARWFQPMILVGQRQVKATFAQNERSALKLEDGRFAARNVYVFPLEELPPRGIVTLVVQHSAEGREVLRALVDLSKFR